jgi:hypothetical protein
MAVVGVMILEYECADGGRGKERIGLQERTPSIVQLGNVVSTGIPIQVHGCDVVLIQDVQG